MNYLDKSSMTLYAKRALYHLLKHFNKGKFWFSFYDDKCVLRDNKFYIELKNGIDDLNCIKVFCDFIKERYGKDILRNTQFNIIYNHMLNRDFEIFRQETVQNFNDNGGNGIEPIYN